MFDCHRGIVMGVGVDQWWVSHWRRGRRRIESLVHIFVVKRWIRSLHYGQSQNLPGSVFTILGAMSALLWHLNQQISRTMCSSKSGKARASKGSKEYTFLIHGEFDLGYLLFWQSIVPLKHCPKNEKRNQSVDTQEGKIIKIISNSTQHNPNKINLVQFHILFIFARYCSEWCLTHLLFVSRSFQSAITQLIRWRRPKMKHHRNNTHWEEKKNENVTAGLTSIFNGRWPEMSSLNIFYKNFSFCFFCSNKQNKPLQFTEIQILLTVALST